MNKPFTASEVRACLELRRNRREQVASHFGEPVAAPVDQADAMLNAYADRLEADEQSQAQSGEWVIVPREPTKAMIEASCKIKLGRLEALRDGHGASSGVASAVREEWDAMLAAAPQQAAEPVAWAYYCDGKVMSISLDHLTSDQIPCYACPQPAQDASKYQELLMAVSKKFPNESRHETALRYIKQTELQSCEPKCDAAMAKEYGR